MFGFEVVGVSDGLAFGAVWVWGSGIVTGMGLRFVTGYFVVDFKWLEVCGVGCGLLLSSAMWILVLICLARFVVG